MSRSVRRVASVVGVVAFGLVSIQATGPVDAAGHEAAVARSSTQTRDCSASRNYSKCPAHVYRVRMRASATEEDDLSFQSGSYDLVARVEVRYAAKDRRDSYPPTVALASGLTRPKLVSFRGSGTAITRAVGGALVCSVRTKLRAGPIGWGIGGDPSRIHRSKTPRIVYYTLRISIGPTQNSPEPKTDPTGNCPGEGGATTSFEKRLRSSDYEVAIGAHTSPLFTLNWDFHRPQAAGRMAFPLDRITTGKRFELRLSGRNPFAVGTSKGTAHVIFEPVR